MKKQIEDNNTEMTNVISRTEEFINGNQKTLITALIAIVVVVVAIVALNKLYFQPRQIEASEALFAAEQWFDAGEYQKALDGDDTFSGLLGVIDSYGSTRAGNLAKYYAGAAYLHMGDYTEALHWLKKYKGKDTFTGTLTEMMIGDAEMELDNAAQAAKHYAKAARMSDNIVTTPTALFKAGMAELKEGNKAAALKNFNRVKDQYPESTEWREIDKYISLVENMQ